MKAIMKDEISMKKNSRKFFRYLSIIVLVFGFSFSSCNKDDEPSLPVIESFTPAEAGAGAEVVINGQNLENATSVQFNGTEGTITSKTPRILKAQVPEGATTGKITVTTPAGTATSTTDFTFKAPASDGKLVISDFEETPIEDSWHTAEDGGGEIQVSTFENDPNHTGTFYHLKAVDLNGNYWVGGKYHETSGVTEPFGVTENDPTKVFFNVDIKANGDFTTAPVGKLVFAVHQPGAPDNRMNWEVDFVVDWKEWKTMSLSFDKFHRWDPAVSTFVPFSGDANTVWSCALYIAGGNKTDVYDLSFDNVIFTQGEPLGDIITPAN